MFRMISMLTSCCSSIDVSRSLVLLWLNYPPTSELTSGFHTTNTHSTAVFDSLLGVMQTRMTVMKPRPVYEDRLVGYQTMWRLLIRNHHLRTSHSTVRLLLCQMDPAGVEERQHHRLRRRAYFSRGPNDTWHIDGYDKLWPYVILINGYDNQYATDYNIVPLACTYVIHSPALSVTYVPDVLWSMQHAFMELRWAAGQYLPRDWPIFPL